MRIPGGSYMRKPTVFLLALSVPAAGIAASPSLVQNEYVFARDVAAHGIRDGFLMHLDKQSITFAPKPVNAYDFYTRSKPNSTKLQWYPAYAVVSSDGSFGVDTGPWTADWTQDGKPRTAAGEWLTVWERDSSGAWLAQFDGGASHGASDTPEKALAEETPATLLPVPAGPPLGVDQGRTEVVQRDKAFSDDAAKSLKTAYENAATDDIRLLLDNTQPLVGREPVLKSLPGASAELQWVAMGGSVAHSGDLAYLYGMTYKSDDADHA